MSIERRGRQALERPTTSDRSLGPAKRDGCCILQPASLGLFSTGGPLDFPQYTQPSMLIDIEKAVTIAPTATERPYLCSWIDDTVRDTADQDYVAARANYRLALHTQAAWSAAQAIEKYLKGILLFSCVPVNGIPDTALWTYLKTSRNFRYCRFPCLITVRNS